MVVTGRMELAVSSFDAGTFARYKRAFCFGMTLSGLELVVDIS